MRSEDYEDPEIEERWCDERRADVAEYLAGQNVKHGEIGEWPAWHFAPYVSVWAIESLKAPGRVGWWAISGDLPTDYVSAETIKHPRTAIYAFGDRWEEVASHIRRGQPHPTIRVGLPDAEPAPGPLLSARAKLLVSFAEDDAIWEDFDSD